MSLLSIRTTFIRTRRGGVRQYHFLLQFPQIMFVVHLNMAYDTCQYSVKLAGFVSFMKLSGDIIYY